MSSTYELTVRGRLGDALTADFAAARLVAVIKPVETVLVGPVADQAALHGLLRRIEALGLDLVAVREVCVPATPPAPD